MATLEYVTPALPDFDDPNYVPEYCCPRCGLETIEHAVYGVKNSEHTLDRCPFCGWDWSKPWRPGIDPVD